MNTQTIPILIGVTGHRAIREADRPALTDAVTRALKELQARCPHSQLLMLNSLAAGADLLCAEAAEALGIGLIAVLPMEQAAYEADFDAASLAAFHRQLARAEQVFVAPPVETVPTTPTRDFAYRQAGIYLAEHAHTLLALWDGGEKSGCGTAPVALLTSVRLSGIDAGGVNAPWPVIVSMRMPSTASVGQTNVTPAGTWIVTSPAMVSVDFPSASGWDTVIVPSSKTVPPVQPLRRRRTSSPPPRFVRTHGSSAPHAEFAPFVRTPSTISLPPASMLNTQSGLQWFRCE